jgi:hypothetical protein
MCLSRRLAVMLAVLAASSSAFAQATYPDRPIKMVVPLAAASAVDVAARMRGSSPEELGAMTREQLAKYARVIKAIGIGNE